MYTFMILTQNWQWIKLSTQNLQSTIKVSTYSHQFLDGGSHQVLPRGIHSIRMKHHIEGDTFTLHFDLQSSNIFKLFHCQKNKKNI